MSIYSSVTCPKCKEKEMSLATAFAWGKIRLSCDCGFTSEIAIKDAEVKALQSMLKRGVK